MTSEEALRDANRCGQFGQFEVSGHALKRMAERNATRWDISCALRSASRAVEEEENSKKWRLEGGCDEEGEPLVVVIILTARGLVVTIF